LLPGWACDGQAGQTWQSLYSRTKTGLGTKHRGPCHDRQEIDAELKGRVDSEGKRSAPKAERYMVAEKVIPRGPLAGMRYGKGRLTRRSGGGLPNLTPNLWKPPLSSTVGRSARLEISANSRAQAIKFCAGAKAGIGCGPAGLGKARMGPPTHPPPTPPHPPPPLFRLGRVGGAGRGALAISLQRGKSREESDRSIRARPIAQSTEGKTQKLEYLRIAKKAAASVFRGGEKAHLKLLIRIPDHRRLLCRRRGIQLATESEKRIS